MRNARFHLALLLVCASLSPSIAASLYQVDRVSDVGPVWSGIPVGFVLQTHGDRQFALYYDDQRRMTVAARSLASDEWEFSSLPEKIGWDSHNYIAMIIDDHGYLHISGNMHCVPLVYFRSARPLDIHTFQRIESMVGREEKMCTYPRFMRGPENELIFTYRTGRSGNGNQIYNRYDYGSRTWTRLLDEPLTDGEGKTNAYLHGPVLGPDGSYHLCWVWRDHAGCESNHDLCYARSKDLRHWTKSDGTPLDLPITLDKAEIVDPVPPKGGIINGNHRIGFDRKKRPIITYHKFDEQGNTQVYHARLEAEGWKTYQTTDWDYRWDFQGGGSIQFEIVPGKVRVDRDGGLAATYRHPKEGSGMWRLDEETFKILGQIVQPPLYPSELGKPKSDWPGMNVRWTNDQGKSSEPGVRYALRHETLGSNRDQPRKKVPPASPLKLYRFVRDMHIKQQ